MASAVYPSTGGADFTIQVGDQINSNPLDESELEYPDNFVIEPEKFTFYVERKYTDEDGEEVSKCSMDNNEGESTEQQNKKSVAYNLWPYKPIHVGGYKWACHLSKLGEIRCWSKWHDDEDDVEDIFKQCLPTDGVFEGTKDWLASFNPVDFGDPINLGCRDSDPATGDCPSNEKYKALAFSVGKDYNSGGFDKAFACAILDDQKVKCWGGANAKGQLGQNSTTSINDPSEIAPVKLGKVKAISSGLAHNCVILDRDGADNNKVKCWGDNSKGQLGLNNLTTTTIGANEALDATIAKTVDQATTTPSNIDHVGEVRAISSGLYHTCAILRRNTGSDDKKVKCWGDNTYYQLGLTDNANQGGSVPIGAEFFDTISTETPTAKHLVAGFERTCIIKSDDSVICRSWDRRFHTYHETSSNPPTTYAVTSPVSIDNTPAPTRQTFSFENKKAVSLALGVDHTCTLFESGEVNCFGRAVASHPDNKTYLNNDLYIGTAAVDLNSSNTVQYIDSTRDEVCVSLKDGQVKCWGDQIVSNTIHDRPEICEESAP